MCYYFVKVGRDDTRFEGSVHLTCKVILENNIEGSFV